MKPLFLTTTILLIMTTFSRAQDGKASTEFNKKNQTTQVSIDIQSDAAIIWTLLTNAHDFPRWNSTIISIEGDIALNEKIKLKVHLDPKRTFKIKVKEMQPEKRMVWGDGKGTRIFTLTDRGNGVVNFHMTETIGGFLYGWWKKFLPPFDEVFEQYAADLKKEAETIQNMQN